MDGEGEITTSLTGARNTRGLSLGRQITTLQVDLECQPNNEPLIQHER